jgi:L-rhamnose isomerase
MPFGVVWDYYCMTQSVPVGTGFIDEIRAYEQQVLSHRS